MIYSKFAFWTLLKWSACLFQQNWFRWACFAMNNNINIFIRDNWTVRPIWDLIRLKSVRVSLVFICTSKWIFGSHYHKLISSLFLKIILTVEMFKKSFCWSIFHCSTKPTIHGEQGFQLLSFIFKSLSSDWLATCRSLIGSNAQITPSCCYP